MFVGFDESEHGRYYVLGAFICDREDIASSIVKKFASKVRKSNLSQKDIMAINSDPKEYHLFQSHKGWLGKYIDLISNDFTNKGKPRTNLSVIARYYEKTSEEQKHFSRPRMLNVYCELFIDICRGLAHHYPPGTSFDLVFDRFKNAEDVLQVLQQQVPYIINISSLDTKNGHQCKALLVADIIAGTVRRHVDKDAQDCYYHDISSLVLDVNQVIVPLNVNWVVQT